MRFIPLALLSLLLSNLQAGTPAETTLKSNLKPEGRLTTIFSCGEDIRWCWSVPGKEIIPADGCEVSWELEFWDGARERGQVDIDPGSDVKFTLRTNHRGWAKIRTILKSHSGKPIAHDETTLVIGENPAKGERNFRYGIIGGTRSAGDDYKRAIEVMDKLGVDVVRGDFSWGEIQPSANEWRFAKFDRIVEDLKLRGIEMEAILCYTTQWASTGNRNAKNWLEWARAMPEMAPWLEYVKTTVKRYKGSVRFWEIWNEPDIGFWNDTAANYARLFNETSSAIHEVNPDALVLNGGLALIYSERNPTFRESFLGKADRTNWNIRAYHDYNTFRQMVERYPEHKTLYQRSPLKDLPIWINEGGFHTLVSDGDRHQAINLVKKMASGPALPQVSAYIWYNLNDIKPEGNDPEHRFGVVDYYFRPKPAYGAYQYLIHELAPRKYVPGNTSLATAKGVWMQLYRGADTHQLVIWQEGAKALSPLTLKWSHQKTDVTGVTDLMGNPQPLARLKGQVLITVGNEPMYVSLKGEAEYPSSERFLDLPDTLALLPGANPEIGIAVNNPTAESLQVGLEACLEGENEKPVSVQVSVPAGASRNVALHMPTLSTQTTSEGRLRVGVHPAGADGSVQAVIPYEKAIVVPRTQEKETAGYLVELNKQTQVVNLFDTQGRSDQAWRGVEDLSAQGRVSYDDNDLNLRIVATDDRHVQAERIPALWRGDSLQMAMRLASPGATSLEITFGLSNSGEMAGWVNAAPEGGNLAAGGVDPKLLPYKIEQDGTRVIYTLTIPWKLFGRQSPPSEGFRLSFLINDNDGEGRRQWVELSPGIGKQKDTSLFPLFICK